MSSGPIGMILHPSSGSWSWLAADRGCRHNCLWEPLINDKPLIIRYGNESMIIPVNIYRYCCHTSTHIRIKCLLHHKHQIILIVDQSKNKLQHLYCISLRFPNAHNGNVALLFSVKKIATLAPSHPEPRLLLHLGSVALTGGWFVLHPGRASKRPFSSAACDHCQDLAELRTTAVIYILVST